MSHKLEGVVLSITPYQEASAMSYVLTKDYGLVRFVLQGFYKPTSKMQAIGMPFAQVIYRTNYQANRLLKCFGGEVIQAHTQQRQNYEWLVLMSLMAELIIHNYDYCPKEGLYEAVLSNLETLRIERLLKLVVIIIEGLGLHPYLSACVVCEDHRIHGFSLELGGFTCKQHTSIDDSYEYLVLLGQLFHHKTLITQDQELLQESLVQLVRYLEFHTNVRYNSIGLL